MTATAPGPDAATGPSATPVIEVEALVKRYEGKQVSANAVDGISFGIPDGELLSLLGPSGCGKTTTLRMIAGLERPTAGLIRIGATTVYSSQDDVYVPANRRPIGMVFQSYAIWPHMTVFENVAYPLRVGSNKRPKQEVRERTEHALEAVGLADYAKRAATALSGGQQQRAALARALVKEPKVLLLDEPLSNLDAKLRDRMREWIREIQARTGVTTVFVTHDQDEALAISDRIFLMDDGRIVEEGLPEQIYCRPRTNFAASFVGAANRLAGTVESAAGAGAATVKTAAGSVTTAAAASLPRGAGVSVYVRPEHLRLSLDPQPGSWAGVVKFHLYQGSYWDYHVAVGDDDLRVRLGERPKSVSHGQTVHLVPDADNVIVIPDPEAPTQRNS